MKSRINSFVRSAALAASIVICLGQAAHAGTYYWDTDDITPGFGTTTGTWGTDAFWSTDATGTTSTANTTITTADNVNFGTATNPLVVGSINGPATPQGFLTMTFGNPSGNAIGLVGGTLNLAPTSTITASNTGNNNIISTVLQGSGSKLIKNGSGSLRLQGSSANTYSGLTTVSFGTLFLDKTAGVTAIAGNMILDGQSTVQNSADNQIADTATVTVNNVNAKWELNGKTETIDTLTLTGNIANTMGFTTGTTGKLTVNNLNVNASGAGGVTLNSSGSGNQSTITANTVTNTGGTWVFGVANGTQSLVVGSGGLTIGGGSTIAVNATAGSANFISLGGNVTSQANAIANIISGAGTLRLNDTRTFDVADGAAASDLTISTIVANGTGTGAITKTGAGTMTLSGANSYTGATSISAGTLALGAAGSISTSSAVTIAASAKLETTLQTTYAIPTVQPLTLGLNAAGAGSSGQINAAGLDLNNATLAFDISGPLDDAAYVLATYTSKTPATFSSVPTVSGYTINYVYNGGTQIALVQSAGSDYNTWGAPYGLSTGSEGGDLDGDGLTNQQEYAFGLIPNSGSSVNPILVQLDKTSGQFTYQRRKTSLTAPLTYKILTSTGLITWNEDTTATATQVATAIPATDNESVLVTLTGAPLSAPAFFVRVSAE